MTSVIAEATNDGEKVGGSTASEPAGPATLFVMLL